MKEEEKNKKPEKGAVIPAGTEQETGLTRGQTEKLPDPETSPSSEAKKDGDETLINKN